MNPLGKGIVVKEKRRHEPEHSYGWTQTDTCKWCGEELPAVAYSIKLLCPGSKPVKPEWPGFERR